MDLKSEKTKVKKKESEQIKLKKSNQSKGIQTETKLVAVKHVEVQTATEKNKVDADIQTDSEKKKVDANMQTDNEKVKVDAGTGTLFSKVEIDPDFEHNVTCLCRCHGSIMDKLVDKNAKHEIVPIANCNIQLFKYTTSDDIALDSLVYHEDYDDYD